MNADRLLAHYEQIADAPDAIARMRRFVLDIAVRGRLVEQDSADEPASELLKNVATEMARLVKTGELRKRKILPPFHLTDIPVEDISGWIWVRLGEVATMITKGSTPTSYGHAYTTKGVNFVKIESIKSGLLLPENITSFIANETHDVLARSQLAAGDILFSIAGSIGTCAIVTDRVLPANINQALAIIRGTRTAFLAEFLLKSLQSSVARTVMAKARGGAMNNISLDDIQNLVVPLPPLAEQHRIVAKVDELMALCDRLEVARAEREATRDRLATASLARLNAPDPDPSVFKGHAVFAFENFAPLTTRLDQIKALRQTILQPRRAAASWWSRTRMTNRRRNCETDRRRIAVSRTGPVRTFPHLGLAVKRWCGSRSAAWQDASTKPRTKEHRADTFVTSMCGGSTSIYQIFWKCGLRILNLPEFTLRFPGDVLICEGGEPGRAAVWDDREGLT